MDINSIFAGNDNLGQKARAFVEAAGAFLGELSKTGNGLEVALMELDNSGSGINVNYDAPVLDAYKKTYRPITASEIAIANKEMSQALAGEKWTEGFLACAQLMMALRP